MKVLKTYYDEQSLNYSCGIWCDYISVKYMALLLKTSAYQIAKAYKQLVQEGYLEIKSMPSYYDEYYNGLCTVPVPILYTKAHVLTEKARTYFAMRKSRRI